jgi:hypothetical protein
MNTPETIAVEHRARITRRLQQLAARVDSIGYLPVVVGSAWALVPFETLRGRLERGDCEEGVLGTIDAEGNQPIFGTMTRRWSVRPWRFARAAQEVRMYFTEIPKSHQRRAEAATPDGQGAGQSRTRTAGAHLDQDDGQA